MSNTVTCTNKLCGKEYHIDFEKCPFCGTESPLIEVINKKKELKQKAIDQKLEHEKQLEEKSGGKYQSSYRLLVEGGLVKGETKIIWELIPIYAYIIGLISFIGFSIIGILLITPNYPNRAWFSLGLVASISGLVIFLSYFLYAYLMKRNFNVKPMNDDVPPGFGTFNSIGITCIGSFREVGGTQVSYAFFSLIFPLIPIGCYRVIEGPSTPPHRDGVAWKSSTSYKVYGSEKGNFLEILHVYLYSWSVKIFILSIFFLIIGAIFD